VFPAVEGIRLPSISFVNQEEEARIGDSLDLACVVNYASDYSVVWMKKTLTDPPLSVPIVSRGDVIVPDTRFKAIVDGDDESEQMYTLQVSKM
jgi:hypothetical protein